MSRPGPFKALVRSDDVVADVSTPAASVDETEHPVVTRLRERAANGDRYEPPDLRGQCLAGHDLSGLDLSDADLDGADLSGATLRETRLRNAKLNGARLDGANLGGADLCGSELRDASLEDVAGYETSFGRADLRGASLFGANLANATLSGADLRGCNLGTARLPGARLREANLGQANLFGAELTDADLSSAKVDDAQFDDARMKGARLCGVTGYEDASWLGAAFHDADFTGAYLLRRFVMDQNYLHEFRSKNRWCAALYWMWWLTSDCGRSLLRWSVVILLVALVFAGLSTFVDIDYGGHETMVSPIYYSVVTLTTLGYGDVLPASGPAQVLAMLEVVTGYMMLGGLLSIFSNKMARRAE